MSGVPVLMYHGIAEASRAAQTLGTHDPVYTLTPRAFEAQMKYLLDGGFRTLPLAALGSGEPLPERAVVITFDDGNVSDRTVALPVLQALGLTAHFFLTTGWLGRHGFLGAGEVEALAAAGMGIGSHGHTHAYFDDMTEAALRTELTASLDRLRELTDAPVGSLAPPGGRMHDRLSAIAAELGIDLIGTSAIGVFQPGASLKSIPRIAITRGMTLQRFDSIARGSRRFLRGQIARKLCLDVFKRTLGNARYDRIRSRLLK